MNIKVYAQVCFEKHASNYKHYIRIYKNNILVATYMRDATDSSNVFNSLNITTKIFEVNKDDTIRIVVRGTKDDKISTATQATYMTVEEI